MSYALGAAVYAKHDYDDPRCIVGPGMPAPSGCYQCPPDTRLTFGATSADRPTCETGISVLPPVIMPQPSHTGRLNRYAQIAVSSIPLLVGATLVVGLGYSLGRW
jgi:hypothetical protein